MIGNVMEAIEAEPMMEWNPEFRYGHREVRTASAWVMERMAGSQVEKTWECSGTAAGGQVIAYPAAGDHRTGTEMGNRESQTEMAEGGSRAARRESDLVPFHQRSNTDWYDLTEMMPDWQEADAGWERLLEPQDREEIRDEAVTRSGADRKQHYGHPACEKPGGNRPAKIRVGSGNLPEQEPVPDRRIPAGTPRQTPGTGKAR